jgi:hypothetical protein
MRILSPSSWLLAPVLALSAIGASPSAGTYDTAVRPVLEKPCAPCHNDRLASGGLNLGPFSSASSLAQQRQGWERILDKLRSGEMPPPGVNRPEAEIEGLVIKQFVYLLDRLDAATDGGGTLLDSSMIVYGSGLADGNSHQHHNLPLVLAGRARGTIRPGRHIRYPAETPITNLYSRCSIGWTPAWHPSATARDGSKAWTPEAPMPRAMRRPLDRPLPALRTKPNTL